MYWSNALSVIHIAKEKIIICFGNLLASLTVYDDGTILYNAESRGVVAWCEACVVVPVEVMKFVLSER